MEKAQNPDFSNMPRTWHHCFNSECPRHDECLRYLTGQSLTDDSDCGPAIYPAACDGQSCRHFKQIRIIQAAYGFKNIFKEVRQKDYVHLRSQVIGYLGSQRTYYRYNRGDRKLSPEQQEHIARLFQKLGYSGTVNYEHYAEIIDFG